MVAIYTICNKYTFIKKCIIVISRVCKVYLFNDGLTCMLKLLSCLPGKNKYITNMYYILQISPYLLHIVHTATVQSS